MSSMILLARSQTQGAWVCRSISKSTGIPSLSERIGRPSRQCPNFTTKRLAHAWSDISLRDFASLEDQIFRAGSKVVDPILQENIGSLKWLQRRVQVTQDNEPAQITLQLPSPLHPALEDLKDDVQKIATEEFEQWKSENKYQIDVGIDVEVRAAKPIPSMARYAEDHEELASQLGPGLINVSQFLAVYSCKGGVGKSTVAVNLAYELARLGGRIGLLDLDIYGPSLPILVKPDDPAVRPSPTGKGMVYPVEHKGVKLLSLGYVSPKSGVPGSGSDAGAAVMRGPMAGRVVTQLLKATDWGDLDVLVLDLPPGTGDVQLAVCQELQLSGAVAVTTPSKLATEDTRKGIEMFTSMGIPTLGVVENMSYFVCEGGSKHYPFGRGVLSNENDGKNPANTVQLPISSVTNDATDSGVPVALTRQEEAAEELAAFEVLAKNISRELMLIRHKPPDSTNLISIDGADFELDSLRCSIDQETFLVRLYSESGATQVRLPAPDVRARDPKTGELLPGQSLSSGVGKASEMVVLHKSSSSGEGVKKNPQHTPTSIERKGRYGYAVEWGDGATIIYSMLALARAAVDVVRGKQ